MKLPEAIRELRESIAFCANRSESDAIKRVLAELDRRAELYREARRGLFAASLTEDKKQNPVFVRTRAEQWDAETERKIVGE